MVYKIVIGVMVCQVLLDEVVCLQVDVVIVYYGYFWKNELLVICGMKCCCLKILLVNDINFYGWYLLLDVYLELGNNVQLVYLLGINVFGEIELLVLWGELLMLVFGFELVLWIEVWLGCKLLWCGDIGLDIVSCVVWCIGGGQSFIDVVVCFGVDVFIIGEVLE